ncbi:MAG: hypothetical protein QME60_00900 [Verrucomicrobiota bacterium]|nr:hypothetical protein [Verrucomicrobiota bacterium]
MLAAALAYGRVAQILRSVRRVLDRLGPSPHRFILRSTPVKYDFALTRFGIRRELDIRELPRGSGSHTSKSVRARDATKPRRKRRSKPISRSVPRRGRPPPGLHGGTSQKPSSSSSRGRHSA